jgi:signal transduction histidine kinase
MLINLFVPGKQRQMFNNGNGTFIGIIVGICSTLVVIVSVMVIAIRNKRNNDQGNLELVVATIVYSYSLINI